MEEEFCPCCGRHCPLTDPHCERGKEYAKSGEIPAADRGEHETHEYGGLHKHHDGHHHRNGGHGHR